MRVRGGARSMAAPEVDAHGPPQDYGGQGLAAMF
jgi:hypothetical protein